MRKLRKRMDRKGTNTINTFLKLNLSPLPLTEKPVENKCERFAQSIPAVTQPKASIPLQDYRQGHSFLSCLTSQDAIPSLQGQNPFERNPILKISDELRRELQCIKFYHQVSGKRDLKKRGNSSLVKRTGKC